VLADRVQITQVLTNVARNAFEAMEEQAVRKLSVSSHRLRNRIEIRIADTGPGLSETARLRLFEPFATTKDKGTGLGLSICRTIVEAHGGRIRAEPATSGGAAFVISLPIAD
jgi:two-component system sensor kinase FixL